MALPLHADVAAFYVFAVWMLDSREQALVEVAAGVRAAPQAGLTVWVADLIRTLALAEPRGRGRDDRFAALGELLRLDHSIAVDLDHPAIAGDVRRLHVLQWEVKRACLTAAVRALWPTRRGMFVLMHVLGRGVAEVAALFETTVPSIRITNARTLRTLEDYLKARCQHLNPDNPCTCEARLGVALEHAFVAWPAHAEAPATAHYDGQPRELAALFRSLPAVALDDHATAVLRAACGPDPA